ncbi:MAG: hypothetical protein A2W31_06670 [Planctomycetes bacterium RBG_16_64_10]|nr:MAG: hypothetical protein A2W31_06670 [Planctomycetes bacterium RBG_16_64_10]
MDFKQRLEKATERGQRARTANAREQAARALSAAEFDRLHANYRIALCEQIENRLRQLADHFPGFQFDLIVSDRGWGASVHRDDVGRGPRGQRDNFFSHLEMVVSPHGQYHILELRAKGTIRNKEIFNRCEYQLLNEVDIDRLVDLVELWALQYVEQFAAQDGTASNP